MVTDEFKAQLTATMKEKIPGREPAIYDELLDQLLEMLMGLFDSCIGQMTPVKQAARMADPGILDKIRLRNLVRRNIFEGDGRKYRDDKGQELADSVLDTTEQLGQIKCAQLITELTTGDNYWPNSDLFMG